MLVRLTTTGRKSGLPRIMPIYVWPDGDGFILVGSNGGDDADPAWVGNVRTTPIVTMTQGKRERTLRVREITDADEFRRAWEIAAEGFPDYRRYQRKTERQIPLFMLEPIEPAVVDAAS
jgi:deazaflavin-dependent oxidoreductase (nitroreductase family)